MQETISTIAQDTLGDMFHIVGNPKHGAVNGPLDHESLAGQRMYCWGRVQGRDTCWVTWNQSSLVTREKKKQSVANMRVPGDDGLDNQGALESALDVVVNPKHAAQVM